MRLGRCSWPSSLMVPPIVAVIQGLPSLIYICEPCHSHLQAFVSLRTVRVSDTRAVRAFRIALSAQWRWRWSCRSCSMVLQKGHCCKYRNRFFKVRIIPPIIVFKQDSAVSNAQFLFFIAWNVFPKGTIKKWNGKKYWNVSIRWRTKRRKILEPPYLGNHSASDQTKEPRPSRPTCALNTT